MSTDEAVVGALDAGEPVRGPLKGKAWSLQKRAGAYRGRLEASQNATGIHRSET
jgi:hypothetical protein